MTRQDTARSLTGFSSFSEYKNSILQTPQLLVQRALHISTPDELQDALHEGNADLQHVLSAFDLVCFGIGSMLGAGVFVTTGYVAAEISGPAVILSYLLAGLSALLSSFCYAEFAVAMPFAGGAYTYISASLGQFLAWVTVANLILEYLLSNAAVVRGFAPYFALLLNQQDQQALLVPWRGYNLDWWSFGLSAALTLLLVLGTRKSAAFNTATTVVHVVLVAFIIVAGAVAARPSNALPFMPHGARGVFNGASVVFFSYIGFDAVATAAEESSNPTRDLPIGILGAVGVVTCCYILMAAVLVMMIPVGHMPGGASFAQAFQYVGMSWARYLVALGACMGIVSSLLVGMYGASRIITGVARDHLIPPILARVHSQLATPWPAILVQGLFTALIALFTDFAELSEMVSISTLFAFWIVALALLWRRSYVHGSSSSRRQQVLTLGHLGCLLAASLVFSLGWRLDEGGPWALVASAFAFAATVASFSWWVPPQYNPAGYKAPLYPLLPALSVALNTFLMCQLQPLAYLRFFAWTGICVVVYLLYGLHASAVKDHGDVHNSSSGRGPLGALAHVDYHAVASRELQQQVELEEDPSAQEMAVLVEKGPGGGYSRKGSPDRPVLKGEGSKSGGRKGAAMGQSSRTWDGPGRPGGAAGREAAEVVSQAGNSSSGGRGRVSSSSTSRPGSALLLRKSMNSSTGKLGDFSSRAVPADTSADDGES